MTAITGEVDVLNRSGRPAARRRSAVPHEGHSGRVRVLALPLGRSVLTNAALASALDGAIGGCSDDADGLLIAFDSWVGEDPPHPVAAAFRGVSGGGLSGRPVGLIGVGDDARRVSENLAWLRAEVREAGGYPVGAGLWIDPADCSMMCESDVASIDVTLVATLVRFGRRVRSLAWARRTLRAG